MVKKIDNSTIKLGDKVFLYSESYGWTQPSEPIIRECIVSKITSSRMYLTYDFTYNNGSRTGSSKFTLEYKKTKRMFAKSDGFGMEGRAYLFDNMEDIKNLIQRKKNAKELREYVVKEVGKLPLDALEEVKKIIDESKKG